MTRALAHALILAGGSVIGFLVLRSFVSGWFFILVAILLFHTLFLYAQTPAAQGSPVRWFALTQTAWFIAATIGILLFLESAWTHLLLTIASGLLLAIFDYHILRFVQVPAQRSRTILLFTSRVIQGYTVYLIAATIFGLITNVHVASWWLLFTVAVSVFTMLLPWMFFVEKRPPYRWISTAVVTLALVEGAWALVLLPIGNTISAIPLAVGYFLGLHLVLQVAGELPRDKTNHWLYAGGAILILLVALFFFARWI